MIGDILDDSVAWSMGLGMSSCCPFFLSFFFFFLFFFFPDVYLSVLKFGDKEGNCNQCHLFLVVQLDTAEHKIDGGI